MSAPLLRAEGLVRTYRAGAGEVRAVDGVDLTLEPGELVVLTGASGSGKTTLLTLLAGIEQPTDGRVLVDGDDLATLPRRRLTRLRRHDVGYVFQSFGLVPVLSAAENVEVPLRARRAVPEERDRRVAEVLESVGMGDHGGHRPEELSGGQQQRVAIARALVHRPRLLVADEPTGQLDEVTAAAMMDLFVEQAHDHAAAVLLATHDPLIVERADHVLDLRAGRLIAS